MNFEEFLVDKEKDDKQNLQSEAEAEIVEPTDADVELDVQRAVVESLAADTAEQDEKIASLESDKNAANLKCAELTSKVEQLTREVDRLTHEVERMANEGVTLKNDNMLMKAKLDEQSTALLNVGDLLARNTERDVSNQISLLDHPEEFKDWFEGEIRDHVLEVIREARDRAEKEGRVRRARVLESVLVANEPLGSLKAKREEIEKLFKANANLVSGPVIEELSKQGISHKNGEEYLLPSEIILRNF